MNLRTLIESSLSDLHQSAIDAFPRTTKRQFATDTIVITNLTWIPFLGVKTLFLKGLAQNEGREYSPIIIIKGMNYGGNEVMIRASDGKQYNFARPSLEENQVLVRCPCMDFHWRFNWYNHLDRSLQGSPRKKYESKGIGPPANPMQMPGMCKHLLKMTKVLHRAGIFKESSFAIHGF